jgi:hypothetical protein
MALSNSGQQQLGDQSAGWRIVTRTPHNGFPVSESTTIPRRGDIRIGGPPGPSIAVGTPKETRTKTINAVIYRPQASSRKSEDSLWNEFI